MPGIIQSYGVFWSADDVFWGKGRQAGALYGVAARARSSVPVDFRDQVGIYVLYAGHEMVYVGQTGSRNQRLFTRLRRHRSDMLAGRWDHFSWFGLRRVLTNGKLSTQKRSAGARIATALNHIEAVLIAAAEPSLNRQGGRFGRDVLYLQVRDQRLGLAQEEMIRELWRLKSQK